MLKKGKNAKECKFFKEAHGGIYLVPKVIVVNRKKVQSTSKYEESLGK